METDKQLDKELTEKWYYTVELRPGQYTKGFSFKNIAATRTVLDAIDVKGQRVLDISTMEGMFAVLMARRGASVLSTDAINLEQRVRLLKSVYGVSFDYRPNTPVQNYVENIFQLQSSRSFSAARPLQSSETSSSFGFDVVFSSGLIYHVLNPIDHILNYRRLCKTDGLCLIETASLLSANVEMVHDWHGEVQTYGGNATWFISTKALEVYLKACFFKPLGFAYVRSKGQSSLELARIAIVARAVSERPFSPEELATIKGSELYKNYDYASLYPASQLTGRCSRAPAVDMSKLHDASDLSGRAIGLLAEAPFDENTLRLSLSDR